MSEIVLKQAREISLFPSEHEWAILKEQATMLVKSGFLPGAINSSEKAIAIALKGRELGIPPMQAFAHIHIISGKPTISAELMLALIFKNCPGAIVNYVETSNDSCVIEAKRPNGSACRFSFTMRDAENAKLLNKSTWAQYPGAMLRARAISIMARALFADSIMGCSYTPEELGAEVNEGGEVLTVPNEPTPPLVVVPPVVKPEPPKAESPKPAIRTRGVIGSEIMAECRRIKCNDDELLEWSNNLFGKSVLKDLTIAEMEKLLGELKNEQ